MAIRCACGLPGSNSGSPAHADDKVVATAGGVRMLDKRESSLSDLFLQGYAAVHLGDEDLSGPLAEFGTRTPNAPPLSTVPALGLAR